MPLVVQYQHGFGLNLYAFGQGGNADGGAGGVGLAEVFRHHFVENGKIV